jgi:ketosteroid isomerase-like protein
MPQAIQQHDVPAVIRSVAGMERPDYVDLFTATTDRAAPASPEQWARTALDRVAGSGGQFIWRRVLGLRLASSPQRVAGWTIADRGEDWIRLEAASWFLTAHLVVRLADGRLFAGTFIRYDHPIAPIVWIPASAIHRRLMPGLLEKTVRVRARREPLMTPTEQGNATVMLGIFDAIERRDPGRLAELCHTDVEFVWPAALPYGGTTRGLRLEPPSWIHTWAPLQPTDAERSMEPRVVASNGDEVVVLWHQRGLGSGGERFDGPVLALYRVREGRLARAQMFYFDTPAVVEFLGRVGGRAA